MLLGAGGAVAATWIGQTASAGPVALAALAVIQAAALTGFGITVLRWGLGEALYPYTPLGYGLALALPLALARLTPCAPPLWLLWTVMSLGVLLPAAWLMSAQRTRRATYRARATAWFESLPAKQQNAVPWRDGRRSHRPTDTGTHDNQAPCRQTHNGQPAPAAPPPPPPQQGPPAQQPPPRTTWHGEAPIERVQSTLRLEDVAGLETIKGQLMRAQREIMGWYHAQHAGEMTMPPKPRNGILLHGAPGNGKTLLVHALAGTVGLDLMEVRYQDVASRWVHETTEWLAGVFRQARRNAPVLLFIDEIDAFLTPRGQAGSHVEAQQLVDTFLTESVRLRDHAVLLVGATNMLERIDGASVRAGRFDYHIEVPPPDEAARRALLATSAKTLAEDPAWAPGAESLVLSRTAGYCAAQVELIAREMAELALARGREPLETARLPDGAGILADGTPRYRFTVRDFEAARRNVRGTRGHTVPRHAPPLSEVILPERTREALENLLYRIAHPERTARRGGTLPSGLLFSGPPGNGKTITAMALAREADWAFLPTSGAALLRESKAVHRLLAEAREARPALIFIDEADDILAARVGGTNPLLNELLGKMSGTDDMPEDVIFIAATNRPEALDTAALRGGRLSEKYHFPRPTPPMTWRYVQQWLDRSTARFSLTIDETAELLAGRSFADVEAILQLAANRAVARECVTAEDLRAARATVEGVTP